MVPGHVVIEVDVSTSVSETGEICARYAGGGEGEGVCVEECAKSGVVRVIRTLQSGKLQSIQLETNFDYTRGKLINSKRNNFVTVWLLCFGLLVSLLT